jgi:hypothetical protein
LYKLCVGVGVVVAFDATLEVVVGVTVVVVVVGGRVVGVT